MLERIEVMLKLNETPIRTANNFRINNIEIDIKLRKEKYVRRNINRI